MSTEIVIVKFILGLALLCGGFGTSAWALRHQSGGVLEDPAGFIIFIGGGAIGAGGFALMIH